MVQKPNWLAGGRLDRLAQLRTDEAWFRSQLMEPMNRVTPVWRSRSWLSPGEPFEAGFLPLGSSAELMEATEAVVLLGSLNGVVYFAADLSHVEDPSPLLSADGEFGDLRQVGALLDPWQGSLLAYARGILHWHRHHGFCSVCGQGTVLAQAGHVRVCSSSDCKTEHFPRTDPAVIMLVSRGERALLARQSSWPAGFYSTLAGFVEPGESLEEAVAREVREEVGIVVEKVHYHSSQPWPFPASLMLGFRATATDEKLCVDPVELEDARWFTHHELLDARARKKIRFPPPVSIARRLIDDWLEEEA